MPTMHELTDAEHDRNRRTNRYVCTCPGRATLPPASSIGECPRCHRLRARLGCTACAEAGHPPVPATHLVGRTPVCTDHAPEPAA